MRLASLWLLAAVILNGCAAAKGAGQDAGRIRLAPDYTQASSVCGLLDKTDLEAILGYNYDQGAGQAVFDKRQNRRLGVTEKAYSLPPFTDVVGMTTCWYGSPDSRLATLNTGVATSLVPYIWKQVKGGRKVKGLGEEAYWKPGQMLVLYRGKLFGLTVRNELSESSDQHRERAKRLTKKALSRLK